MYWSVFLFIINGSGKYFGFYILVWDMRKIKFNLWIIVKCKYGYFDICVCYIKRIDKFIDKF